MKKENVNLKLNEKNVNEIFDKCALTHNEYVERDLDNIEVVEGVQTTYGFNKTRIAENKAEIKSLVSKLPLGEDETSLYNLCNVKDGSVWGNYSEAEKLVALGVASNVLQYTSSPSVDLFPMVSKVSKKAKAYAKTR